ncbi:MAG: flagellar basal body L-ring protein FlgH [Candidatus Gastranaerophilales bacterium]|nr:flagellar basal body L-ring protein FlgH [Candidatus Gastranaerophilales bacterium]MCM1073198.1 flagellar basal body L-ring protein FlgH [Bacteroides sp.]
MKKFLITFLILMTTAISVNAESLFTLGATQHYQGTPRSLFGGVQARQIGDLVSIVMSENIAMNDNLSYSSAKESNTVDTFTSFVNKWFGLSVKDSNGYGGSNEVSNSATGSRAMTLGDRIACQVVQQLPNGNISVQGKKTIVTGNERMDFIVTGVVDPRWLNEDGEVYSYNVSNLQFALSGRGSISRSQNEGIFNRFIRYLF